MISIEYPQNTVYWILTNGSVFVKGETLPEQVTSANDDWTIHLQTNNRNEWQNECITLNIWEDETTTPQGV
jgi:hypothetical protein